MEQPFREKPRGGRSKGTGGSGVGKKGRGRLAGVTRLFIGVGRSAGLRPKDLVGAIIGEAGIRGNQIGGIQISERFAVVEVSADVADHVMHALRNGKIKGKKVKVRVDNRP